MQFTTQKMQHGAVELQLCVLRLARDGAVVKRHGFRNLAVVGQHVREVAQRGRRIGVARQRLAIVRQGQCAFALLATDGAQSDPEFGGVRILRQRRLDQGFGGREIAFGSQKIGEIDERFEPSGLGRKDAAEKRLGGPGQPQDLRRISQGKQDANVVRPHRQRALVFADRFGMPRLRGQRQSIFVGIALQCAHPLSSHASN